MKGKKRLLGILALLLTASVSGGVIAAENAGEGGQSPYPAQAAYHDISEYKNMGPETQTAPANGSQGQTTGLNEILTIGFVFTEDTDKNVFFSVCGATQDGWNEYGVRFWQNGTVNLTGPHAGMPEGLSVGGAFTAGEKYILALGVVEVFSDSAKTVKVAERLFAEFYRYEADPEGGPARKVTLKTVAYDDEAYGSHAHGSYLFVWADAKILLAPGEFSRDYKISLNVNGEIPQVLDLSYGESYDLAAYRPEAFGFTFLNWYYYDADNRKVAVPESGVWTFDFAKKTQDGYAGTLHAAFETDENQLLPAENVRVDSMTNLLKWNPVERAQRYAWSADGVNYTPAENCAADVAEELAAAAAASETDLISQDFYVKASADGLKDGIAKCTYEFKGYLSGEVSYLDSQKVFGLNLGEKKHMAKGAAAAYADTVDANELMNFGFQFGADSDAEKTFISFMNGTTDGWNNNYSFRFHKDGSFVMGYGADHMTFVTDGAVTGGFQNDVQYTATFGVRDLIGKGGLKAAERFILRFSSRNGQTGEETLLAERWYDNYDHMTTLPQDRRGTYLFFVTDNAGFYATPAYFSRDYKLTLINGSDRYALDVSYGKDYDFTSFETAENGYEFVRWYYLNADREKVAVPSSGKWGVDFTTLAEGAYSGTLTAEIAAVEYRISYEVPHGGNSADNPAAYTVEDEIALADPAPDESYIFLGWYDNPDYSGQAVREISARTGNLALYAKIVEGCKITVEYPNASETLQIVKGESHTLSKDLSAEGYTVTGWEYYDAAAEAYVRLDNPEISPAADMRVRAVCRAIEYAVTYELDGGSNHADNPAVFTVEDELALKAPERQGYLFDGWFTDADFTRELAVIERRIGALTLYAKFVADTLPESVTFFKSGEKQAIPQPVLPDGSSLELKLYRAEDRDHPLALEDQTFYRFTEAGSYTVIYSIVTRLGEAAERELALTVEVSVIRVSGSYDKTYERGTKLTIFSATSSDGSPVEAVVRKDGEIVLATGNSLTLETGVYEIKYTSELAEPLSFTLTVNEKQSDASGGCGCGVVAPGGGWGGGGLTAALLAAAGIALVWFFTLGRKRAR